jgi:serine/threonine protein kinase
VKGFIGMNCPECGKRLPEDARFCLACGHKVIDGLNDANVNTPLVSDEDVSLDIQSHQYFQQTRQKVRESGAYDSDRYIDRKEIGRGGFAVVYKAYDTKLNRYVAIKQLHRSLVSNDSDSRIIERFRREAQSVAALQHLNIVNVFDQGTDDTGDYIIMEYIESGSLESYIHENGVFPIEETVRLATGICRGLQAAHYKNLVHRDIKPANILLAKSDNELIPKIVDFGLVRAGESSEVSQSGFGLGTRHYMAPEQFRDAKNVNHTADIYSFGKLLYFMQSGEHPHSIDPDKIPNTELIRIINKCCKSNPEDRYFSCEIIIQDLQTVLEKSDSEAIKTDASQTSEGYCSECGFINKGDVKFCSRCGTNLAESKSNEPDKDVITIKNRAPQIHIHREPPVITVGKRRPPIIRYLDDDDEEDYEIDESDDFEDFESMNDDELYDEDDILVQYFEHIHKRKIKKMDVLVIKVYLQKYQSMYAIPLVGSFKNCNFRNLIMQTYETYKDFNSMVGFNGVKRKWDNRWLKYFQKTRKSMFLYYDSYLCVVPWDEDVNEYIEDECYNSDTWIYPGISFYIE